jgi:hypothetical protein
MIALSSVDLPAQQGIPTGYWIVLGVSILIPLLTEILKYFRSKSEATKQFDDTTKLTMFCELIDLYGKLWDKNSSETDLENFKLCAMKISLIVDDESAREISEFALDLQHADDKTNPYRQKAHVVADVAFQNLVWKMNHIRTEHKLPKEHTD